MHPGVAANQTIDLLKELVERQVRVEQKLDRILKAAELSPAEPITPDQEKPPCIQP